MKSTKRKSTGRKSTGETSAPTPSTGPTTRSTRAAKTTAGSDQPKGPDPSPGPPTEFNPITEALSQTKALSQTRAILTKGVLECISKSYKCSEVIQAQVEKPRAMTREAQSVVTEALDTLGDSIHFVHEFLVNMDRITDEFIKDKLASRPTTPTPPSPTPIPPPQEPIDIKSLTRDIKDIVQAAVRQELSPLKEELAALKEKVFEPLPPPPPVSVPKFSLDGEAKMEFGRLLHSELQTFAEKTSVLSAPIQAPSTVPATIETPLVKPPTPPKKPQILIKSKKTPPPDTLSVIKKWRTSIPFVETGAPSKIIPLAYGQFKVEMEKEEALDKVMSASNQIEDLEAKPVRRRPPLLQLKGIPKDACTPEELIGTLERQNGLSGLRLCFLRSNRKPEYYNAVIEATPLQAREVIARGRLDVGYQRVHTEHFIPFVQCQNCNVFGHTKKKCTRPTRCYYCGKRGHLGGDCSHNPANNIEPERKDPNDPDYPTCHNCYNHNFSLKEEKRPENLQVPTEHTAVDRENCTMIKRMIRRLQDETDL